MTAPAEFTPRQLELLTLTAASVRGPDLAARFGLSHKRVRQCRSDLCRQLGVRGRLGLARWWWQAVGRAQLSPERRQDARVALAALRPSERAVAALIAQGLTQREVAARLGLQIGSVGNRVCAACELLSLSGSVALARLVWEADLEP